MLISLKMSIIMVSRLSEFNYAVITSYLDKATKLKALYLLGQGTKLKAQYLPTEVYCMFFTLL